MQAIGLLSEIVPVSLAQEHVNLYGHLIPPGVEIWEFNENKDTGIQVIHRRLKGRFVPSDDVAENDCGPMQPRF
jgi:hypothetical protein